MLHRCREPPTTFFVQLSQNPESEGYLRSELSELVSHHILSDRDIVVNFSVMNLELQADEVWQDGGGAGLCADWVDLHSWDDLGDWEPAVG